MSSGEADAAHLTLIGWQFCRVPGCDWLVSDGGLCHEHGGLPLGATRADEFGDGGETYADPALRASWREADAQG